MRHPIGGGRQTEPHEDGFRTWIEKEIQTATSYRGDVTPEPLADFIGEMREDAEGLRDPGVFGSCWVDHERDQQGVYLHITGWRPATEEEIATWQEKERQRVEKETRQAEETARRRAAATDEADRKALKRAKAAFPELFKDEELRP